MAALAAALALPACSIEAPEAPPCDAVVPTVTELLRDPAFASLQYHKRIDYEVARGMGYDVWADQRFEYRTGLQFTLVPKPGARNDNQLCAQAVALRFALPGDGDKEAKLRAFLHAVARHSSFDEERLRALVLERLARSEKFRAAMTAGPVAVEAGVVSHPARGDFFVVVFGRLP